MKSIKVVSLIAIGVAVGVGGVYFADYDDSPGAGVLSILLMLGAVALAVRAARQGHSIPTVNTDGRDSA